MIFLSRPILIAVCLAATLTLIGCSQTVPDTPPKNIHKYQLLKKSRHLQLPGDEPIEIVVTLIDPGKKPAFILTFVNMDPDPEQLRSMIRLNGKAPENVEKISYDRIPIAIREERPRWASHFRVAFPESSAKRLILEIQNENSSTQGTFYRDFAYLHEKYTPL